MKYGDSSQMIRYNVKELLMKKGFEEKRNITIQEVAKELNINTATLSRIANSKGNYNTTAFQIERLCRYFNCTPNDLITIVQDEDAPAENYPSIIQ